MQTPSGNGCVKRESCNGIFTNGYISKIFGDYTNVNSNCIFLQLQLQYVELSTFSVTSVVKQRPFSSVHS